MRGIRLLGGDLPELDGGGGVLVPVGELDGCAFLTEENSLGQYYSYDPDTNLCYVKAERGRLVNDSKSSQYTSGSPLLGGCDYSAEDIGYPARGGILQSLFPDYDPDYNYNFDPILDPEDIGSSRPIIIINVNHRRRQTVRDILAQAAAENPYLRAVLTGMYR